jgi:hypothetical protein
MSRKRQFAGELDGSAHNNPRTYGDKRGMSADVGGWHGMVRTRVWYDEIRERDMFRVEIIPHWQDHGKTTLIAEGVLNHEIDEAYLVPAVFA